MDTIHECDDCMDGVLSSITIPQMRDYMLHNWCLGAFHDCIYYSVPRIALICQQGIMFFSNCSSCLEVMIVNHYGLFP